MRKEEFTREVPKSEMALTEILRKGLDVGGWLF